MQNITIQSLEYKRTLVNNERCAYFCIASYLSVVKGSLLIKEVITRDPRKTNYNRKHTTGRVGVT
jgi:hypothetical protein